MSLLPTALLADEVPVLEKGFEWVDGQMLEKPVSLKSSAVAVKLIAQLSVYVDKQQLGAVFESEASYQFTVGKRKQVRKPDVSFISQARLPAELPDGHSPIAPDLAIEVISPNDEAEDIENRLSELLAAGTSLFWIVYPKTRSVWVLRQDGTGARLTENQDLSGETVVPGFTCRIASLFQGL